MTNYDERDNPNGPEPTDADLMPDPGAPRELDEVLKEITGAGEPSGTKDKTEWFDEWLAEIRATGEPINKTHNHRQFAWWLVARLNNAIEREEHLRADLAAAKARIEALEGGLKPFAEAGQVVQSSCKNDWSLAAENPAAWDSYCGVDLTVGDLRRAAELVAKE
jgi:hypothetical protein